MAKQSAYETVPFKLAIVLTILGIICLLFVAAPLGVMLLIIGIVLMVIECIRASKCTKELKVLIPEYKEASEEVDAAKAELSKYEDLAKKVKFVNAYEAQNQL